MGSGLVSLHMEDVLGGKSFAISKVWLVLGGVAFSQPMKLPMSENQEYRK